MENCGELIKASSLSSRETLHIPQTACLQFCWRKAELRGRAAFSTLANAQQPLECWQHQEGARVSGTAF